jgi:hypothetical protein
MTKTTRSHTEREDDCPILTRGSPTEHNTSPRQPGRDQSPAMARLSTGESGTYRVIRRLYGLSSDFTHNRHGFDGYYPFDREVSLIRDTQEVRGLPENSVCP